MKRKTSPLRIAGRLVVAVPVMLGLTDASTLRDAQADQRFEVVSVRRVEIQPVNGGIPVFPVIGGVGTSNPGRVIYRGTWLTSLITEAFGVRADQITGPAWLASARYDVVANIPAGTSKDQFKIMLGNLLRDRFDLLFHIESKSRQVDALRVGKNGIRFKETGRGTDTPRIATTAAVPRDAQGFLVLPPDFKGVSAIPVEGEIFITAQDGAIAGLLGFVERMTGRPVIDETGLTGHYDFRIHFEWIRRIRDGGADSSPPSVFTAVEEQLGLKLEPASRALDQLVIDSINREPTEN